MNTYETVEVSFKWDKENLLKAFEKSYKYQFKHSPRRYIGWFFIALAQFGVVGALKAGSFSLLMFSTILIFYWYIAKKWLIKIRILKNFNKSPLKDKEISLKITQKGIYQDKNFIDWKEIDGITSVDDDILLYYHDKAFYIPSNAFNSIEDKSKIKKWAKEKGKLFNA